MIYEISNRFHEGVLQQAAARYGLNSDELKSVGGFESSVYEFTRDGRSYIVKITHTIRRSVHYIRGELEWINYLADQGVTVARAVPSSLGRDVEVLEEADGSAFLVICYEKAPGHRAGEGEWNGPLFEALGRLMGQMHTLAQNYTVSDPAYKRQEWYQEEQLQVAKYVPEGQPLVIERAQSLIARLRELPRDRSVYGLVHADLHSGNFFVDEAGRITAFNFDDIEYNWFMNDIAITLFYARFPKRSMYPEEPAFIAYFLKHFMEGYSRYHPLDPDWFRHVPDFLMLRHILLYTIFFQSNERSKVTEAQWAEQAKRRKIIEDQKPIVDFDFDAFAKWLRQQS